MTEQSPVPLPPSQPVPGELGIDDVVRFLRGSWRSAVIGSIVIGGVAAGLALNKPRDWEANGLLIVSSPSINFSQSQQPMVGSTANLMLSSTGSSSSDTKSWASLPGGPTDGNANQPLPTFEIKPFVMTVLAFQRILESSAVIANTRQQLIAASVLKPDDDLKIPDQLESRIFTGKRDESTLLAPMIECRARWSDPRQARQMADTWIEAALAQSKMVVEESDGASFKLVENCYQGNTEKLQEFEKKRSQISTGFQRQHGELDKRWDDAINAHEKESALLIATQQNETEQGLANLRISKGLPGIQARIEALTRSLAAETLHSADTSTQNATAQQTIADRLTALQNELVSGEAVVKTFERTRINAAVQLKQDRSIMLASLTSQRKAELDELVRSESLALAQMDRQMNPFRLLDKSLSSIYGQIHLAKAQQVASQVKLTGPISMPNTPIPRGAGKVIAIAALLGFFAGLGVALMRSIIRRLDAQGG